MYQYFKRQLKTPTRFGSFGIHPQGVLNVLHWNYLCQICTVYCTVKFVRYIVLYHTVQIWHSVSYCSQNFTLPNTDYAHKTSQVISVKRV